MNKKPSRLILPLLLLLVGCIPVESTQELVTIPNVDTLIIVEMSGPETVDPAWAYWTTSAEIVFNVYETLIFYEWESVEIFVPRLATDWWISEDGLTYTFKIRKGVKFHNGVTLTTEDVEYSFERAMVLDMSGGPIWMIYKPLLGVWHANLSDPDWMQKIDTAVESNATHVWFNLVQPYATFLQILCQPWSSVINKEWAVAHGAWDGNYTMDSLLTFHDPYIPPLDDPEPDMMGTGPFLFDYWTNRGTDEEELALAKFDDYWGGWPAQGTSTFVSRVTLKYVTDWSTRKEMFINGTADIVYVPRNNISEVEGQPGIRYIKDLPILACWALFFNFNISAIDPWTGWPSPVNLLPLGTFNETGIPPDFFSDIHLRRAFAYSFNYTKYIEEIYLGEATQPATPVVQGLPYHNPEMQKYGIDLPMAAKEFQLAWDGEVWTNGFTFPVTYIYGNEAQQNAWEMLEANVESLNPKFHIDVQPINIWLYPPSPPVLSMFIIGWLADYPDPHNFLYEFMHSEGTFSGWAQSYSNPYVDALIEEGLATIDATRRSEIYYELQQIYYDEIPSVPTVQLLGRHWERDWVQGWYYNPAHLGLYFYNLWKGLDGDVNGDGTIDMLDAGLINAHWYPGPPVGPLGYNRKADINPVLAYPLDGRVDIADAALINAHWGETC